MNATLRRLTAYILITCFTISLITTPAFSAEDSEFYQSSNAVYLGVENYGALYKDYRDSFLHRFWINGEEKTYKVTSNNGQYIVQNILQEGSVYNLTIQNNTVISAQPATSVAEGVITNVHNNTLEIDQSTIPFQSDRIYKISSQAGGAFITKEQPQEIQAGVTAKVYEFNGITTVYLTFVSQDYSAPVSGTPGLRTLKNLLATALEPVGTTLYIYGGAWNWQDTGSSNQATSIGLSPSWIDFFQQQNASYSYINSSVPSRSYYPHGAWNQYYYAGMDCSGYVGWVIYNLMNTQNNQNGYVQEATTMAQQFANNGWGTKTQNIWETPFKPGDIFSMNGHVWICLGKCSDGSLVIIHSTPSNSIYGQSGGGVQINGVGYSENCEAVQLAKTYMDRYYPEWYSRYHDVYKNYSKFYI